ncbi:hypothetical protein D3C77_449760 [compost metagenome]
MLSGIMYKVLAKFNAAWWAAIVSVSKRLISSVTAANTAVSKKMARPIGTPSFNNSFHFASDTPYHLRKIP